MTMAYAGVTSVDNLTQALNRMVASAISTRYYMGRVIQRVERHTLRRGTGETWIEPQFGQLEAFDITPHQLIDNPQQQRIDRVLTVTPTGVAVVRVITDNVMRHLSPIAYAQMGTQMGGAMQHRRDIDGILAFNSAAKTLGSASDAMAADKIRAAATQIRTGAAAAISGQISAALHGFQLYDIEKSLTAVEGTSSLPAQPMGAGLTAQIFRSGIAGQVGGAMVVEDNNISIDNNQAAAPVFARESCVLVNDSIVTREPQRVPEYGEGATRVYLRDKYGLGLRRSDEWAIRILSDATKLA